MTSMPYEVASFSPHRTPAPAKRLSLVQPLAEASNDTAVEERLYEALQAFRKLDDVLEREVADVLFDRVVRATVDTCPREARTELLSRLARMERSKPKACAGEGTADGATRFDIILGHVLKGSGRSEREDLLAIVELITIAVHAAPTPDELRNMLRRVPPARGVVADNIVALLAKGIPSWDVKDDVRPLPLAVRAIEKVIGFARDENTRATRFRELMLAAAEALNEGSLSAAVFMLDVAKRILAEGTLHPNVTDRILLDALRAIEEGPFETFLGDSMNHAVLRKVLEFFPSMHVTVLIEQFCDLQFRERRTRIGNLLVAWGTVSRPEVLRRLDVDASADGDHVHDLYALLSRLPVATGGEVAEELNVLDRASNPGRRHELVLCSLAALAALNTNDAAKLLIRRLAQFESLPFRSDKSFYTIEQVHELLDATVAALARTASPEAIAAIVRHALANRPALGDARQRLRHLAALDLSIDLNSLAILVRQIDEELPARIFGRGVAVRPGMQPTALIQALAGTNHDTVRALLISVAEKFSSLECGQAAAKALAERRPITDAPRVTKTGILSEYSLPSLLSWLLDGEATGLLSLANREQEIRARIWVSRGSVIHVECGNLDGVAALYQLLERPVFGSYAFSERRLPDTVAGKRLALPLTSVLVEGLRRHEELRSIVAVVPDDVRLCAGSRKPTPDPVEKDGDLLRRVWLAATSSLPVREWESRFEEDTWRLRRIVARWFEEGALRLA